MESVREKTGSIAVNGDVVQLNTQGLNAIAFDLTGTFVGTVIFEYTINGKDWYTLTAKIPGTTTTATGATAVGKWKANNIAGYSAIRIRATAFTSGPILVAMRAVLNGDADPSSSAESSDPANKVNAHINISSSTSETELLAAVVGMFVDVYLLLITNLSATTTNVTIKDDTAGTTRFVFQLAGGETKGFALPKESAHKQAAANKPWTATSSVSVASVDITALGLKRT